MGIHNLFHVPKQRKKRGFFKKKSLNPPRFEECHEAGIALYSSYSGAALECAKKGIFDFQAVIRVVLACVEELAAVSFSYIIMFDLTFLQIDCFLLSCFCVLSYDLRVD